MSIRPTPGAAKPGRPQDRKLADPVVHSGREARRRALERAYPLLKQAAEILELEAIEPVATHAKRVRQEVGALLVPLGRPPEEFQR